jgi:hypothetical protein
VRKLDEEEIQFVPSSSLENETTVSRTFARAINANIAYKMTEQCVLVESLFLIIMYMLAKKLVKTVSRREGVVHRLNHYSSPLYCRHLETLPRSP